MKNIIYNFNLKPQVLICAIGLVLSSCSDLEDVALDKVTDASSIAPEQQLASVYNQLGHFTDQAATYALTEHSTDEMMGPTRGTDWDDNGRWRNIHTHTWSSTADDVVNSWDGLNKGHALANEAINNAQGNKAVIAEATFLRAFFMYNLVDLFGQVPFKETDANGEVTSSVLSRSEATDRIISDLESVMDDLSSHTSINNGKATKEAAKALLAKTYLNRGVYSQDVTNPAGPFTFAASDMAKVIELADEITATGNFGLTPNYFDNFTPNNTDDSKELIFAIANDQGQSLNNGSSVRNRYYMTLHYNNNPGGWNGFTTLGDFYNSFESGDSRLGGAIVDSLSSGIKQGFLVGQQYDEEGVALTDRQGGPLSFTAEEFDFKTANETQGVRVIKYSPDYEDVDAPANDYVFLRYADVLLMKAEAMMRSGDSDGALEAVNEIRVARGLEAATAVTEASLLAERGHELYWEGWRRNDLIRFEKFLEPFSNKTAVTPAFRVLFPIPQKEIEINPNLKQNFGY